MLYRAYHLHNDLLTPLRAAARLTRSFESMLVLPFGSAVRDHLSAALELISRFEITHSRPDFGIRSVDVEGAQVAVTERVALDLPFGRLLHFAKEGVGEQPRVLVVAPLSGHFATLLRGTVRTLLPEHDVYITDWANARDVPVSAGRFGVEEHIDYLIRFIEALGPDGHVVAVCQPCVQALATVALMSEDEHPAVPRSLTLMAGPIDTRLNPTEVNELAMRKPLWWFRHAMIQHVPFRHAGRGRRVYPGFLQLLAFLAMNPDRHRAAHRRLYAHLAAGETDKAERIRSFYDEYFAVADLTEEFYLETVDRVFQRSELATGTFDYRGRAVKPAAIRRTTLLTVEGERDDICSLGQTAAAHELCKALRPAQRIHHVQPDVGHYGVFNGRHWEDGIYPVVRRMIAAVA